MSERDAEIKAINDKLSRLKQGTVTRLTNDEDLLQFQSDCEQPFPRDELTPYFIDDLIGIIKTYLDWDQLNGLALFDSPFRVCRVNRDKQIQILFGRLDGGELIVRGDRWTWNKTVSGHFPILYDRLFLDFGKYDSQYENTRFLIGLYNRKYIKDLYPDFTNCYFQWRLPNPRVLTNKEVRHLNVYEYVFYKWPGENAIQMVSLFRDIKN